ncbi:MAG: 5-(carboxyamino)imidazole ribonucleotide synthase [Verrucomicrobia bacterium]|nr:5-(carboxyamino)imidazole ribonucleotide synthase [Verrucomicrobiota bacterium]
MHERGAADCRPAPQPAASAIGSASAAVSRSPATRPDAITLGIVGGGQLAKMTAQAAAQLGCKVVILERQAEFPAGSVAARTLLGDWDEPDSLLELAALTDVVTLENEFVDAGALAVLEQNGYALWPSSGTMRLIQDKLVQKQTLAEAGLPVPRMRAVERMEDVASLAGEWGLPLLLKARRNAYDGKGNATLRSLADLEAAWHKLGGHYGNPLFAEVFCPFAKELAVIVTRSVNGEVVTYPVVETVQRNHVCHVVSAPAPVAPAIAERAAAMARRAVESVGAVGSFGVEMFLVEDGQLLINEIAPRVHNSGHYTIEACVCSQFENHVRAVLGWPLGLPAMRAPAAVMVNLLASADGPGTPQGLAEALRVEGAHLHIYGKTRSAPGRKMGHVTALGATPDAALAIAQRAAACIRFGP